MRPPVASRGVSPRALLRAWHLLREYRHIVNLWFTLEKFHRLGKEVLGNFTVQVRFAALFIGKGVENCIALRPYVNRKPRRGALLFFCKGLRGFQNQNDDSGGVAEFLEH